MDASEEKKYHSIRQTTGTLFLVAYILSVAFRKEFLPLAFGYLALIPVAINLVLFSKIIALIITMTNKKLKRKRIASVAFGILVNLIITAIIVTTLITGPS